MVTSDNRGDIGHSCSRLPGISIRKLGSEKWDREFESGLLQRRVCKPSVPQRADAAAARGTFGRAHRPRAAPRKRTPARGRTPGLRSRRQRMGGAYPVALVTGTEALLPGCSLAPMLARKCELLHIGRLLPPSVCACGPQRAAPSVIGGPRSGFIARKPGGKAKAVISSASASIARSGVPFPEPSPANPFIRSPHRHGRGSRAGLLGRAPARS